MVDELPWVQVQVLRYALLADDLVGALRVGAEKIADLLVHDAVPVYLVIHLANVVLIIINI